MRFLGNKISSKMREINSQYPENQKKCFGNNYFFCKILQLENALDLVFEEKK